MRDHWRSQGLDVEDVESRSFDLDHGRWRRHPAKVEVRDSLAFLRNERTGRFVVLDCHDFSDTDDLHEILADRRCQRVLKCQYDVDELPRARRYRKVRPWSYFEHDWPFLQDRLLARRDLGRTEDALYFRGHAWEDRKPVLAGLRVRRVTNPDTDRKVGWDRYVDELARHRLTLSLPGMGETCHRDMEAFAVGTALMRPRLCNTFADPLVADRHYVAVDVDIEHDPAEQAVDRIIARWHEVRDDHAYLADVAAQGAAWWDRNVRRDACLERTAAWLGLP